MKQQPLTLNYDSATPISTENAFRFFGEDATIKGERRFQMELFGPWQICKSITGLAITCTWKEGPTHKLIDKITLHGDRTMTNCRESGYQMEGRVSIKGKKYRAFTSSTLFELPNGKLISVATLHVCS